MMATTSNGAILSGAEAGERRAPPELFITRPVRWSTSRSTMRTAACRGRTPLHAGCIPCGPREEVFGQFVANEDRRGKR
jgi:hypothetical protein